MDPVRLWSSLDDKRVCILCDKTITGRMIDVRRDRHGTYKLHCPTPGCPASARDWFYRGPTHRAPLKVIHRRTPVSGFGAAHA